MPDKYNQLRPLAFYLNQEAVTTMPGFTAYPFWTLDLPEELKQTWLRAIARGSNRPIEKIHLPVRVLNSAARMLIPNLISIGQYAGRIDAQPWLYGFVGPGEEYPATVGAITELIRAWIWASFPDGVSQATRKTLVQQVTSSMFTWKRDTMDLTYWQCADNGTALPYEKGTNRNGFVLWPDLIAAKLSQAIIPWEHHLLAFRRVPLSPGQRGAELVSWPPIEEPIKGQIWPYSVLLTLTLQTVPFQNFPVLHCDIGVRRWAGPKVFPKKNIETSVYLLDQVPWIQGLPHSQSFQIAPIRWGHIQANPETGEQGGSKLVWGSDLVPLLKHLHIEKNHFPDPQELADHPYRFLHQHQAKPVAAIVYHSGLKPSHEIGTGFMPGDRRPLAEQIEALLQPEFHFVPPYERQKYSVAIPSNPFFEGKAKKQKQEVSEDVGDVPLIGTVTQRLKAVAAATTFLRLIIYYQSEEVLKALRVAIEELLGYPAVLANGEIWSSQNVTIIVESHPLGSLGTRLAIKEGSYVTRYERQREAMSMRATEIANQLESVNGCVGVLIELDNEDKFDDDDPKHTLRIGFGRKGYLTQFITPQPDDIVDSKKEQLETQLKERARASVRDLLRQCGVIGILPAVPSSSKQNKKQIYHSLAIPEPLHYLSIWLIKLSTKGSPTHINYDMPVLLHMASNSWSIEVLAPGWKDWLPYRQAQLALLTQPLGRVLNAEEMRQFLLETLNRCLPNFGDTLLFCHAQKLRGVWKWLGNEQITRELPRELQQHKHLRIVRLRTGDHEIPEWYAQNDKNEYGFTKGVFALGSNENVFACVQDKPSTTKNSPQASRVLSHTKMNKQTQEEKVYRPIPSLSAWNPGICEMTISCANAEDALMCAVITNELRYHFASHFRSPTVYPMPLHLASLLDAYLLPLSKPARVTGNIQDEEE